MQIRNMGRSVRNQSFFCLLFLSRRAGTELRALRAGQLWQGPLSLPAAGMNSFLPLPRAQPGESPLGQPPDLVFGVGGPPSRADQGDLGGIFWTSLPAETLFLTTSTLGALWPKAERLM